MYHDVYSFYQIEKWQKDRERRLKSESSGYRQLSLRCFRVQETTSGIGNRVLVRTGELGLMNA